MYMHTMCKHTGLSANREKMPHKKQTRSLLEQEAAGALGTIL
jgi:hypothetical protein